MTATVSLGALRSVCSGETAATIFRWRHLPSVLPPMSLLIWVSEMLFLQNLDLGSDPDWNASAACPHSLKF